MGGRQDSSSLVASGSRRSFVSASRDLFVLDSQLPRCLLVCVSIVHGGDICAFVPCLACRRVAYLRNAPVGFCTAKPEGLSGISAQISRCVFRRSRRAGLKFGDRGNSVDEGSSSMADGGRV